MPIIMWVTGEASIIKLPRRWPICGVQVVGATSIKNRDNSNCLFPHVRFLPKVHGDRVIYGKLAELGWLHSTWNRATLKAFGGPNPSLSASFKMITWSCPQNNLTKFTKCVILNLPQSSMAKAIKYLLSILWGLISQLNFTEVYSMLAKRSVC